jgi:hypothetical protein
MRVLRIVFSLFLRRINKNNPTFPIHKRFGHNEYTMAIGGTSDSRHRFCEFLRGCSIRARSVFTPYAKKSGFVTSLSQAPCLLYAIFSGRHCLVESFEEEKKSP